MSEVQHKSNSAVMILTNLTYQLFIKFFIDENIEKHKMKPTEKEEPRKLKFSTIGNSINISLLHGFVHVCIIIS